MKPLVPLGSINHIIRTAIIETQTHGSLSTKKCNSIGMIMYNESDNDEMIIYGKIIVIKIQLSGKVIITNHLNIIGCDTLGL